MKYLVIPINLNHLMFWHPTQFGSASKTKHNNFFLPNSWLCMEMPYPRLMAWSMAVLPLWAGRWILLQMLGRSLIKYSTYSKRVIKTKVAVCIQYKYLKSTLIFMYIVCIIHVCASLLNFWNSFRANNTLPVRVVKSSFTSNSLQNQLVTFIFNHKIIIKTF